MLQIVTAKKRFSATFWSAKVIAGDASFTRYECDYIFSNISSIAKLTVLDYGIAATHLNKNSTLIIYACGPEGNQFILTGLAQFAIWPGLPQTMGVAIESVPYQLDCRAPYIELILMLS